jgi:diguanylate cyclase (GGDEF)-like protein
MTEPLTTSIGVALFPAHGESLDLLVRHADEALYAAKHAGRNTIRIGSAHEPVPAPA